MLVKLSLFVLADVSTDRQQLGHGLPSDYQQEASNLPSTSSCTPSHVHRNDCTHASWQYKDLFLSVISSQHDRKWHSLVRDGDRSMANLLSFSRLYTSKLQPLLASCCCFAMTSACKYLQPTRTKFWACSKLVCGQIGLACTLVGNSEWDHWKYWQAHAFCGELQAAKIATPTPNSPNPPPTHPLPTPPPSPTHPQPTPTP